MFSSFQKVEGFGREANQKAGETVENNEGKYTSKEFKKFYEDNGITRQFTTLGDPQFNESPRV